MKVCTKCGQDRPLDEYYNKGRGKTSRCKTCIDAKNREWYARNPTRRRKYSAKYRSRQPDYRWFDHTLRKYGVDEQEYNRLLTSQNGVCAICKRPESRMLRGKVRRLGVDHDHLTLKVRGLLCDDCNNGIARLGENIEVLQSAIRYLEGRMDG